MSAETTPPGVALERREASASVPLPPMDDAEVAALWRTAKALAESQLFKDARQAGQAFAKILAGRDLGLTPFEAMSSLHVIEGKIEASSDLHATRVRGREGYDFRVAWLKITKPGTPPEVEAVWADEEDIADLRETFGCAIEFTIDGKRRAVSRFTLDDAAKAGLVKPGSGWAKFPRNMLYARAMTNGVGWYVPEVMGGVRVYGLGELPRPSGEDLTAGEGNGSAPFEGDALPTAVEAVLARARELGHAGLANREAAALAVGGQPPEVVVQWVARATRELNRTAAGHEPTPEPEPPDAEVVEEPAEAQERPLSGEGAPEPESTGEPVDAPQAPTEAPEAGESQDREREEHERAEALRERAADAEDAAAVAEDSGHVERAQEYRAEAEQLCTEADAADDPGQSSLLG